MYLSEHILVCTFFMIQLSSFLRNLPLQIIICVGFSFFFASYLNQYLVQLFYSLSCSFIDILLTFLPAIIFIYIFCSIVVLDRRSPIFVGLILTAVTLSNLTALFTAYGVSLSILQWLTIPDITEALHSHQDLIKPLWAYHLPKLLGTDKALLLGLVTGLLVSFIPSTIPIKHLSITWAIQARTFVTLALQKAFIPFLPLYILGFCLKLSYEQSLSLLFECYAQISLISLALVILYILLLYAIAAGFRMKRLGTLIKTMAPAGITGFCTMSSAATLPVTLKATYQNTRNEEHTNLVIPSTANIHMLGDDLTIVLCTLALLVMNGQALPDFSTFALFAIAFSFAKLSCVGIPGASVLVILPVLERFLGFDPTMISILTTIYVLQDSFGTCSNVMGNGAFAVILEKVFSWMKLYHSPAQPEDAAIDKKLVA